MAIDYKELKNGGFMRQIQKDCFSLRLKVVGGNLTSDQLSTIAETARRYGNGYVHLTSRQGVEIPFVKIGDVENVKRDLEEGGVYTGVCGPRVRTVTACQGQAICPSGCIDTTDLAEEISDRYFGDVLPHKFKFGVTGCMNNCLKAEENDLGIKGVLLNHWDKTDCTFCGVCEKTCREGAVSITETEVAADEAKCINCGRCVKSCPSDAWKGESAYILSFGGTFGNQIAFGKSLLPPIADKKILFRVADAALAFFRKYGKSGERFRKTIEREGWDTFEVSVQNAYAGAGS